MGAIYECSLLALASLLIPLEAITVSPALCPTNKIAPYKRQANWHQQYGTARTFGAFYDLLVPGGQGHYGPINDDNNLQEQPQEDDSNDCGEIEDYDENDLSSITPQGNRRQASANRIYFGHPQNNRPPNYPERPPHRPPNNPDRPSYPQRPQANPSRPTRPPYWSGGLFGTNDYRPPQQLYPSDNIKPIHEYSDSNSGVQYRPTLVGGSLNHVIGVSPVVPTTEPPTLRPEFNRPDYNRPELPPRVTSNSYLQRRPKSNASHRGVLGSFVDLFFK